MCSCKVSLEVVECSSVSDTIVDSGISFRSMLISANTDEFSVHTNEDLLNGLSFVFPNQNHFLLLRTLLACVTWGSADESGSYAKGAKAKDSFVYSVSPPHHVTMTYHRVRCDAFLCIF